MFTICCLSVSMAIKALLYTMGCGVGTTTMMDMVFILLSVPAIYADIQNNHSISFAAKPIFTGLIFRILLLLLDLYGKSVFALPHSGNDSEMYYSMAVSYAQNGSSAREGAFQNMMGSIFSLIGTSRLYGQFIVALFSIVSLVFFAKMLSKVDIPKNNRVMIMWIVALLPNYAMLSSVFIRESVISMFIAISFWRFVKWMRGANMINIVLAFVFALTASAFHSGSAGVVVGYVAVILLYDKNNKVFRFKLKNILPAVLVLFAISYLFVNYNHELFGKMARIDEISDISDGTIRGASSYAQYVGTSSTPINMIIYTIPRILYFLFSPFPWQWRGLSDIIAFFFSSLFFILAVWYDIKYLKSTKKNNRTLLIALNIIAWITVFVFAWGVTNTGTACRHRDKLIIIWGLILALAYSTKSKKQCKEEELTND